MRKLLLLIVCMPFIVSAQQVKPAVISLTDRLPLIAETHLFIDRVQPDATLQILGGAIKLAIAPRSVAFAAEHYFSLAKPLPVPETKLLEYRITINNKIVVNWQPIPISSSADLFSARLIDTLLAAGDHLLVAFKKTGTATIVQQLRVHRIAMMPKLFYYRNKKQRDSLDTRIAASVSSRYHRLKKAFDSLKGSAMLVAAGNGLQCLVNPVSVNTDSCLQYRLRYAGKSNSSWISTGHLLNIPYLIANKQYLLDIRYAGSTEHTTYTIQVLPYWYQTVQAILVFTLLFAVLLLLLYRFRKYRQQLARRQLIQQLKQLQVQLQPHFVYNALGSIEGLVQQQDAARVNHYLSAFSGLLRSNLLNSQNLLIPLRQDIDLLEKYLLLEQLRYGFQYRITVADNLPVSDTEFPPMLLQPVVENAIKHGVATLHTAGRIAITYSRNEQHLLVAIEDNGTGTSNNKGTGKGKLLTMERIERLSRVLKQGKIDCSIQHGTAGTCVHFIFENWLSC